MLYTLAYSLTLWRQFLNHSTLFSDYDSFCQVEIKLARPSQSQFIIEEVGQEGKQKPWLTLNFLSQVRIRFPKNGILHSAGPHHH